MLYWLSHLYEFRFVEVFEVGVLECHATRYSLVGFERDHLRQQIHRVLVHVLHMLVHWDSFPLRERLFEVLVLHCIWPKMVIGCSLHLEYFENLIYFRVPDEEGLALSHFGIDAADAPDVYWGWVFFGSEEDLGGTVPQSDHLVRIGLHRQAERPRETEVCKFDVAFLVDQQVLWFQIPMHHPVSVAVRRCLQNLVGEFLHRLRRQWSPNLPHILLQIVFTVLKYEIQVVLLINDFLEPNQVEKQKVSAVRNSGWILFQLTQQHSGAWCPSEGRSREWPCSALRRLPFLIWFSWERRSIQDKLQD